MEELGAAAVAAAAGEVRMHARPSLTMHCLPRHVPVQVKPPTVPVEFKFSARFGSPSAGGSGSSSRRWVVVWAGASARCGGGPGAVVLLFVPLKRPALPALFAPLLQHQPAQERGQRRLHLNGSSNHKCSSSSCLTLAACALSIAVLINKCKGAFPHCPVCATCPNYM